MLFLTFALGACCALPSVALAAPEAKGEIVKTLEFTDQNGQNSVVRCAGDVSPSTMKIIMYEGQKKHALRGKNLLPSMAGYTGEPGEGEYRADAAFQKAKPQIRKFGELLWQRALKASLQGQK